MDGLEEWKLQEVLKPGGTEAHWAPLVDTVESNYSGYSEGRWGCRRLTESSSLLLKRSALGAPAVTKQSNN